jgi:hypothetical protein
MDMAPRASLLSSSDAVLSLSASDKPCDRLTPVLDPAVPAETKTSGVGSLVMAAALIRRRLRPADAAIQESVFRDVLGRIDIP